MLLLMLLAILRGDYREALSLAAEEMSRGYSGMYSTKGKSIYQYVVAYCEEKLGTPKEDNGQ